MNLENKRKLIRVGTSQIVPPQFIGALRLVSENGKTKSGWVFRQYAKR